MKLGYRPALDGVRGLAIAAVVSLHTFRWPGHGALGVDLFFVLSGFLITTLLLEERDTTGRISIGRFYLRRARRLFPALFAMLAIYTVTVTVVFAIRGDLAATGHRFAFVGAATGYVANLFALVGGDVPVSLSALWSLSQEEQFYALWPLLLVLVLRRGRVWLAPLLMVAITVLVLERLLLMSQGSFYRVYLGPDTHSEPILVGCLFGALFAAGSFRNASRAGARRIAAAVSLAVVVLMVAVMAHVASFNDAGWVYGTPLLTLFAAACGLVIVDAAVGDSPVARLLSLKPLRFLGQISYSLYLWHLPVLVAFGVFASPQWRSPVALAAAVVLACASRYLIELPVLRRGKQARREPTALRDPRPRFALEPVPLVVTPAVVGEGVVSRLDD